MINWLIILCWSLELFGIIWMLLELLSKKINFENVLHVLDGNRHVSFTSYHYYIYIELTLLGISIFLFTQSSIWLSIPWERCKICMRKKKKLFQDEIKCSRKREVCFIYLFIFTNMKIFIYLSNSNPSSFNKLNCCCCCCCWICWIILFLINILLIS